MIKLNDGGNNEKGLILSDYAKMNYPCYRTSVIVTFQSLASIETVPSIESFIEPLLIILAYFGNGDFLGAL